MIGPSIHLPGGACPQCGAILDATTQMSGDDSPALTGNAVLCAECGAFLVFVDEDGRLRLMTPDETAGEYSESVAMLTKIWASMRRFMAGRRN